MAVVDIFFDTLADDLLVFFKEVGVVVVHLRSDFIPHMDQLPEVGVIVGVPGNMPQGIGEFVAAPGSDFPGRGKAVVIDVDDVGIGCAEFFFTAQCFGIDHFSGLQGFPSGYGQSDHFLEPGGSGGFQVEPFVVFVDDLCHDGVDGEFIAPRMDAQFEVRREAEVFHGVVDDQDILFEFAGELGHIAHIVNPFVEAAGEFRGDGLRRDPQVGDHLEDE